MAAGFREEPRQAEEPLRRQLHRSRAQRYLTRSLFMVRPAVLWRDPDPPRARHWPPVRIRRATGRNYKILPRRLSAVSGHRSVSPGRENSTYSVAAQRPSRFSGSPQPLGKHIPFFIVKNRAGLQVYLKMSLIVSSTMVFT